MMDCVGPAGALTCTCTYGYIERSDGSCGELKQNTAQKETISTVHSGTQCGM